MKKTMIFRCVMFSILINRLFATNNSLRVGCLAGKPPFVDVVNGNCVGLLADAFSAMISGSGFEYSMHFINSTTVAQLAHGRPICITGTMEPPECVISKSDIPSVLFHTNKTAFDVGITFTYATSDRLSYVDTSFPVVETYYTVLIDPKFAKAAAGTLLSSITRPTVMYLFAIIIIFKLATTFFFLLAESLLVAESELLEIRFLSSRVLTCFVSSVESVITGGCPLELKSPVSHVFHIAVNYAMVFMMTVFIAVITSQLTTATIGVATPELQDLAGARIGIQGVLLQAFLEGPGIRAVPVVYSDLEAPVARFYQDNPDRLDGFATQVRAVPRPPLKQKRITKKFPPWRRSLRRGVSLHTNTNTHTHRRRADGDRQLLPALLRLEHHHRLRAHRPLHPHRQPEQ